MSSLVYGVGHCYLLFHRWLPGLTAARVDSRPRRLPHPKAGAWRAKRPREISSAKAREKQATFFEKGETWEKHSFFGG